ncbi:SemiSWEET family transporter [Absiella sp. AM29-15]|uniref:SemiSWEET family transporter n=1 Tax=Absiella sp. AM29-15 TaxID=2292278 RepID=UPI000E40D4C3|nr:SemiSWEET family transporter [Absiella sp. AM29-15]RGC47139.1 hypothetical protein DW761_16010 [Absiella sp. AM29-15]
MDSKMIFRAMGMAIALILVSIFFIYYGITSDQIAMSIIGIALLVLGIVRLIIFVRVWNKHEDE